MKRRMIWMAVTADEYELPMILASSASKLAKELGVSVSTILTREHRNDNGKYTGYKIVKVKE